MANDHDHHSDSHKRRFSRRHALEYMTGTGAGILSTVLGGIPSLPTLLGRAEAGAAMAQTNITIPIIVKDKLSFYWQVVLAGARKAGQDLGVNVLELGGESDSDTDRQIILLENAVTARPAAIVIAPAQFAALGKPIERAAQKVRIIGIDSEVDSKALTSLLKTDNEQAGRIAADILAMAIQRTYADAEGDVAIITALPGVPAFDQRAKGFKEQLAAKYGALAIVADKIADGRAATGFNIMTDLVNAHPELRGVFASNLFMAQGAGQSLLENNLTNKTGDKINIVGFDWDDKLVKFLQDGTIAALVVQDPFRMGYDGIKTALAISKGERVPTNIDTGAHLITKANMNSAPSQQLLHPKI